MHALNQLPAEKVEEARDFILFLKAQYGQREVDESDAWSDEDRRDFTAASLSYQLIRQTVTND